MGLPVACARAAVRALRADDVLFLAAALAVSVALARMRPRAAHFERSSRPTPESDRVGLLVPVLLAVLVTEGWLWAAALNVLAFVVRPNRRRRDTLRDRILAAPLRVPAWWAPQFIPSPLPGAATPLPPLAA